MAITLEACPDAIYVPAHIWTPHFSLFGAFSGFDTIEECYEELTPQIHALETGLSSDPAMNWRLSALDSFQLISNSDAHSPAKLGREASLFDIPMSYAGLYGAIQRGEGLRGTIEFFPEEGKYHFDGHRKCHICMSPLEAESHGGICPVCKKKMTMGVSHRIDQLADRPEGLEAQAVSTGLLDILLPVRDLAALERAEQNEGEVTRLSERYGVVGVHMFCPSTPDAAAHCRNFAPLYAIPEEAATGTSNGALTYYLYSRGLTAAGAENRFVQGEKMGKPSEILSRLTDGGDGVKVQVGGRAVLALRCELL